MESELPLNLNILVSDQNASHRSHFTRDRLLRSDSHIKPTSMRKLSPSNINLDTSENAGQMISDKLESKSIPKGMEMRQRTSPILKRSGSPVTQQKHRPPACDPRFRKVHRTTAMPTLNTKSEMFFQSSKTETAEKFSTAVISTKELVGTMENAENVLYNMDLPKSAIVVPSTRINKINDEKAIQTNTTAPCDKTSQTEACNTASTSSSQISISKLDNILSKNIDGSVDPSLERMFLATNPKLNEWIKNATENYDKVRKTISATKKQSVQSLLRSRSKPIHEEPLSKKSSKASVCEATKPQLTKPTSTANVADVPHPSQLKVTCTKSGTKIFGAMINTALWIVACTFASLILVLFTLVVYPGITEIYRAITGMFTNKPEVREMTTIGDGVVWAANIVKNVLNSFFNLLSRRRECSISLFSSNDGCLPEQ